MSVSWFNNQQSNERFFPTSPDETYAALREIVKSGFKVKSDDDFTKAITFSSGASAFTWGENFTAQVVPAEGGSALRINGVGKVGGQLQQSARTNKLLDKIFADVTQILRTQAGQ
jgi:hypothetical protein